VVVPPALGAAPVCYKASPACRRICSALTQPAAADTIVVTMPPASTQSIFGTAISSPLRHGRNLQRQISTYLRCPPNPGRPINGLLARRALRKSTAGRRSTSYSAPGALPQTRSESRQEARSESRQETRSESRQAMSSSNASNHRQEHRRRLSLSCSWLSTNRHAERMSLQHPSPRLNAPGRPEPGSRAASSGVKSRPSYFLINMGMT